jgi:molybdenum cofactor biosynthesis enzyme MoaA
MDAVSSSEFSKNLNCIIVSEIGPVKSANTPTCDTCDRVRVLKIAESRFGICNYEEQLTYWKEDPWSSKCRSRRRLNTVWKRLSVTIHIRLFSVNFSVESPFSNNHTNTCRN